MTGSAVMIEQEFIPDNTPKVYVIANNGREALAAQEQIERKGGIRLTGAMRESIMTKAVDSKFKKSGEALDKLEAKLAHRAMVAAFGKTALEQLAKIGAPYAYIDCDNGEPNQTDPNVPSRGNQVKWRVGELGYSILLHVLDPLPLAYEYGASKHFVVKQGELAAAIMKWNEDVAAWKTERSRLSNKLYGMLNSVTTYNSLMKTWPQGKKFWEHIPTDFPFRNQVPAIMVEALNEELGL